MSNGKKENKKEKKTKISSRMCRKIRRKDALKMKFMSEYTFRNFYEVIESRFGKRVMYRTFRSDESLTYSAFAKEVRAAASYLLHLGYEKGDRIAIMAESCPNWMVAYVAATSVSLVSVPILPDFSLLEAEGIIKHSGARGIFLNQKQYTKIHGAFEKMEIDLFRIEDLFHIPANIAIETDKDFISSPGIAIASYKVDQKRLDEMRPEESDLASIIYTSGTTGSSKGVMLSHINILRCADLNTDVYVHVKRGARVLSILPMSHVYEFTIGQVLTLLQGVEITFLGKPPAVSVLLPALAEVRPHVMLTVPLLIEKVYRAAVLPVLKENEKIRKMLGYPVIGSFVYRVIGKKIESTFGHHLKFFGIGGAPLDSEVEYFLYRARFPYAIEYGLTETSPLIAGCGPKKRMHKPGFVGKVVADDTVILDEKNEEGVGEILVKGVNVMSGYYERDDLNSEVFTKDGYFRTGDLGYMDKSGFLSIRGRVKTMILGPAGENIYPEPIESLINAQEFVEESLVVPSDGGLLALIKIDIELMSKKLKIDISAARKEAEKYVKELRKTVNAQLSSYSRLSDTELQSEPFERTPTQKIKRFLYPKKKKDEKKQ